MIQFLCKLMTNCMCLAGQIKNQKIKKLKNKIYLHSKTNMPNYSHNITCQKAEPQKFSHTHSKNTLKRYFASNVEFGLRWVIRYTLPSQKTEAGTIMRNAGIKCFFNIS